MNTSLIVVLIAVATLVAIGRRRYQRGRNLEDLRKLHGLPPPSPFRRKDIPNYKLFVRTCRLSGAFAVVSSPAFLLTAGPDPAIHTFTAIRTLIAVISLVSF